MSGPIRKLGCGWLAVLPIIAVAASSLSAECLPSEGVFEGYYHRDRWGVGHFNYFLVHPDLHAQLSAFEGDPIRLVVTKAIQPENPGDSMIHEIGAITPLPKSPLQIRLR